MPVTVISRQPRSFQGQDGPRAAGTRQGPGSDGGGACAGPYRTLHAGGERASEGLHEDGLQEGRWTTWHPNGELESRGAYRYGKLTGRWRFYDAEGTLLAETSGLYEAGNRISD